MTRVLPAILVAALAAASFAGCAKAEPPTPRFKTAIEKCDIRGEDGVEYADEGASLILSTAGEDDFGSGMITWSDVECVLKRTKATEATLNRMLSTRALDGMQDASWKGVEASWTYHPDNGFNISLEDTALESKRD
ncbi:hypothetical protein NYS50_07190 [Curtobacterium flaccumfaciens pv. flaccumfaciens]|uniref:hypothetical protein n=1 Tax=Curtobacterium flaccumfaciens TaxID=2035 RepID=UPI00217CC7B6|nr:hypothetical protein [Curtobacterium flaccumfaciens]MCS6547654.1 hypothetical protein [Curtobacterium flaccumfaciens pv. flaccumfaciens]